MHKRRKKRSRLGGTTLTIFFIFVYAGLLELLLPEDFWAKHFLEVVFLPLIPIMLTFSFEQVTRSKETSVLLVLHSRDPKITDWCWVPARPDSFPGAGTTFLELRNNGHSFIEKFLVEVSLEGQPPCSYVLPQGLAAGHSCLLQVDYEMARITGVRIACWVSPETCAYAFSGPLSRTGTKALFYSWQQDEDFPFIDTEEQHCRLALNA